jgi:hypothetical protein
VGEDIEGVICNGDVIRVDGGGTCQRDTNLRQWLGNDSNASANCPRASPCRTLATAYSVTQRGGEIIALDPADYGPITITGQISILGVGGADIAVAAGTTGITINAGAGDRIIIRHFVISGAGEANTKGIELNTGQLALFNSTLKELSIGLNVSNTKADLVYTDLIANGTGINTSGTGVDTTPHYAAR